MKILYAIQGTGNGHTSRAREIIPHLRQYGELDLLISGNHTEISVGVPILYRFHGIGFKFGVKGGVNYFESFKDLRPIKLLRDIYDLPVKQYDLIINDFEPVSAYAAKKNGMKVHALSHQAAFLSNHCPRPSHKNRFAEWLFRHYAPSHSQTAFHFDTYDSFIHTPIIRSEIRLLQTSAQDHITVYLPAYSAKKLLPYFLKRPEIQWHVFSKHDTEETRFRNVWIRPISNGAYMSSLASGQGLLTGGGFEAPAETLFLNKKLMVVPMQNQYEQQCNAAALSKLGVDVVHQLDSKFADSLAAWIKNSHRVELLYLDQTSEHIQRLVTNFLN